MSVPIRCATCGRFVAYKDLKAEKATSSYEPDSHFGPERIEFTCPRCQPETKS